MRDSIVRVNTARLQSAQPDTARVNPSRVRTVRRIAACLLVVVVAGCGGDGAESGDDAGSGDSERVTGPSIPEQDPTLVATGGELYAAHCASCHGDDLRGTDQGPSHLSIIYEPGHHADGAFIAAAQFGVRRHHWDFGDMPAVPELAPEDIGAVIAFVREKQRLDGFEPYPPP